LATEAATVKQEICSRGQHVSTAPNEAYVDKQGEISASQSDSVVSVESSEICGSVDQELIETTAVDCRDAVDISNTVAISSLENGTLYVLQPVDSIAQNVGCRTLRLVSQTNDDPEQGSTAMPAVLVAASSADMISNSANLAHFLRSAGVKPEPASHAESTT